MSNEKASVSRGARYVRDVTFALLLLALLMRFSGFGAWEVRIIVITGFYSCDRWGEPEGYFPIESLAYFNISLISLGHDPSNVSICLSVLDDSSVPIGLDQRSATIPPGVRAHYLMSIFIPKWARVGFANAYVSVFEAGRIADGAAVEFYIGPPDLVPPTMHLLFPENTTYRTESVPLTFAVDERAFWMGYSLDNCQNVSIRGNTTLTGLLNGCHSMRVYGNDSSGNTGASELVNFTMAVVHDVAVLDLNCSSTDVYLDEIVNIIVSAQNKGTVTETFTVTVYANTTVIDEKSVTLPSGNSTVIASTWDTSNFTRGNYLISAHTPPIQGETNTTDNVLYADSYVCVTIRGDADRDFDVDMSDIIMMSGAYGTEEGDLKYIANCDTDRDGDIDIYDIIIASGNYGKS